MSPHISAQGYLIHRGVFCSTVNIARHLAQPEYDNYPLADSPVSVIKILINFGCCGVFVGEDLLNPGPYLARNPCITSVRVGPQNRVIVFLTVVVYSVEDGQANIGSVFIVA